MNILILLMGIFCVIGFIGGCYLDYKLNDFSDDVTKFLVGLVGILVGGFFWVSIPLSIILLILYFASLGLTKLFKRYDN